VDVSPSPGRAVRAYVGRAFEALPAGLRRGTEQVRKRKAKRQMDDDQVDNDASRAPEPDNLTGAQAEARPEATDTDTGAAEPEAAVTEVEPEATETEATKTEAAAASETAEDTEAPETAEDTEAAVPAEAEGGEPRGDAETAAREGDEVGVAAASGGDQAEVAVVEPEAEPLAAATDAAEQPDPVAQPAEEVVIEPVVDEDPQEAVMAEAVAARAQADSYLDDLRRLQAEFDNYRKRTMREQTARIASASQALVTKLLPVLDNFELAVSHAEQSRDFARMLKGVEMVFGELREVLSNEGLVSIEAEGKPFDPERHEAVVAVEQEGAEPGTVVDVIRKGYEFNGRVLRPAMVKVAR
jgi:molecular chaperone GrpE